MIKRFFCIIPLFFFCCSTFSQVLIALVFGDKLNNGKIEVGIQLAAQGFQFTGIDDKADVGFSFGAYLDVKLSNRLTIANYFMFKSPKGGRNIPEEYWFDRSVEISGNDISMKRHLSYLELTPMLRYNLSSAWSVSAGPQLALNTKATDIYQEKTDDGTLTYRRHIRDHITLMDAGLAIDVQWRLMKGKGMRINVRFAQGFINTSKDGEQIKIQNQTFQIGAGIPIGGKKQNKSNDVM